MNDKTRGEYKRTTPDLDETTGETLARLQATMARLLDEADVELRAQARCPDPDEHVRYDAALAAAEKAERERDEARGSLRARLGVPTESRPLTPDVITDEMVERGRSAYWGPTYGGSVDERVRAILTAALTEPPARPEGAEKIDGIVEDWMNTLDEDPALGEADDRGSLADFLAEHGVRVVTEEKP